MRFSPLREERARRGRGEGPPAGGRQSAAVHDPSAHPTSPRGFWGRWASHASPEGARREARRSARTAVHQRHTDTEMAKSRQWGFVIGVVVVLAALLGAGWLVRDRFLPVEVGT